jgi:hypothetical protein
MNDVLKAEFAIGGNKRVSGVMDISTEDKDFSCWSSAFFDVENHSNIFGKTDQGKHVSLLNCLGRGSGSMCESGSAYKSEIYAHEVIIGYEEVHPSVDKIASISLTMGNAKKLFRQLNCFGYFYSPDKNLIDALNEQKYGPDFNLDGTRVAYFNGEFDIFSKETKLGLISASNYIRSGLSSTVDGVQFQNNVVVTIQFLDDVLLEEAFKRAKILSLFFRFIGGEGLFFKDITFKKTGKSDFDFSVVRSSRDWGKDNQDAYYSEPLMDVKNENFSLLLKNWFERDDLETVRYSFYNAYFRESYSAERLITAANMFDIFPDNGDEAEILNPKLVTLLDELKVHVAEKLAEHYSARDAIINLIKKFSKKKRKSLSKRIEERVKVIETFGWMLPSDLVGLRRIYKYAIESRNYHVHGTESDKLTPAQFYEFQYLFIVTLEFIYATSELIECGWIRDNNRPNEPYHKISRFLEEMRFELIKLDKALESSQ